MTPLRATVTLREAAELIGIGASTAYDAVRKNEFPTPVIKIGGRYVVPIKPLLALLGLEELPMPNNDPQVA
ncbi:helix-turn-helix transcriptional regulator [Corynebacterium gallinarum]|uniref:Helix-turn-helix domain-containing protein n=1 Tax=Corynebacterium gallinarum TaxID=2762214 RepID=A0A8I0HFE7_9CORY|nr:helix-turn-helix domain-containing protein [Corynebacterium gallinarum]MBD8030806.1 helix-turn-helix domain-containing protein [Corynebacterium gallinarum]